VVTINSNALHRYAKDDLWVVSTTPSFAGAQFIARSAFHGPGRNGLLEIKAVGDLPSIQSQQRWYALHGPNASSELSMMGITFKSPVYNSVENLQQLNEQKLPILPLLLGGPKETVHSTGRVDPFKLKISGQQVRQIAEEIIQEFKFNVDQIK
jgi:hypothetical protein